MHVIFIEPAFPRNQREFVRALEAVGARVTGVGESPLRALSQDVLRHLDGYEQVRSVVDEPALLACVRKIQDRGWVDRLEATVEAHVMAAAHVREATGIPGTTSRTAWLCRDKPAMKEALREAGIPCAQSRRAESADEVRSFAAEVGYPVIVKPLSGAGAAGTHRCADDAELERAIHDTWADRGAAVAVEEFVEGHEGFYDTLTCEGKVVHEFISHYFPNVLEAMRTRWISPQIITTNRLDLPGYEEVRDLGKRVIDALGIWTSATHMEWFFGPKGLRFSEIGCRPPGVGMWDLYAAANEFDIYREWASLVCWGRGEQRPSRRFSAGMVALRPDKDGQIAGIDGLDAIRQRHGQWVIDAHVPPPGTPTQGVEHGYMANAWVRMRHPDFDHLHGLLDEVGRDVQLRAG